MIGVILVLLPAVAALLYAVSARIPSLVATLLAAYLAFVAEIVGTTLVLSPSACGDTRRGGPGGALLVAGSVVVWLLRGRPALPLARSARIAPRARGEQAHRPVSGAGRGAARLRARPGPDSAAEQLGQPLVPPPAGRRLVAGAPVRLDSERADRHPEHAPAGRRAGAPLSVRGDREGAGVTPSRSTWPRSRSSSRSTAPRGGSASACAASACSAALLRHVLAHRRSRRPRPRTTSSPRRSRSSLPAFFSGIPESSRCSPGWQSGSGSG